MSRRSFNAPNSKRLVEQKWHADIVVRAIGALVLAGGALPGQALARMLGLSPRGLGPVLRRHSEIAIEVRGAQGERAVTWYRINQKALPAPATPPPLLLTSGKP